MKLYITTGSPYARMTRIVIIEKRLVDRIDVVLAQTRLADSPYYGINPSGRVPYLVRDDGVGMEESALICRYLDHLEGRPEFDLPSGDPEWEVRRLGALASSLLDGLSVWGREIVRPEKEQSPTIIRHESDRARRMADLWETEIDHPVMCGRLNLVQIALACALGLEVRNPQNSLASAAPETARLVRPDFRATVICNDGTTALRAGLRVHGSDPRVCVNFRFPPNWANFSSDWDRLDRADASQSRTALEPRASTLKQIAHSRNVAEKGNVVPRLECGTSRSLTGPAASTARLRRRQFSERLT